MNHLKKDHIQMMVCIQYTAKVILSFQLIQEKIIVLLQRLKEKNAEIIE